MAGIACQKGKNNNQQCDTFLVISSTSTDRTTTVAAGITSIIDSYGGDLCFHYKGMQISQQATPSGPVYQYEYFLRAKAVKDCGPEMVCALAIYQVKDTVHIHPTTAGTYYLNFYNESGRFKRDTVVVN